MATKPDGDTPTHHKRTILPGAENLVVIRTTANAKCVLRHEDVKDSQMHLDADEHGDLRFHVRAPEGSQSITVHLDCTGDDGETTRHTIEIGGDPPYRPDGPGDRGQAANRDAGTPAKRTMVSPLAEDPTAPPDKEFVAPGILSGWSQNPLGRAMCAGITMFLDRLKRGPQLGFVTPRNGWG